MPAHQPRPAVAVGTDRIEVPIPADVSWTMIEKRPTPARRDPADLIATALAGAGAPSLESLAHGRRSACIVICDVTRPVPNGLFLGPMIKMLESAGLSRESITVLVATGLHRPNLGAELAAVVGDPWVTSAVRVINHDARRAEDQVDLGRTAQGTPIRIDRAFVDADLRIVTGLVEPHFMAGWSGGRKVVAPGIAGEETIRTFHSYRFMADPAAVQCNLDGNPLHADQLEIVRRIGEVYALNTVLDTDRTLIEATFGDVVDSHAAAVRAAEALSVVPVGRRFGTVVTSAGGHPLDRTYYQTIKSMVTPLDVVAPGGTLIVAADCSEGLGSAAFADAQRRLVRLGAAGFRAELSAKRLADIDEWQTQMLLKATDVADVQLFAPALGAADRTLTGVTMIDALGPAIAASVARTGDPHVAIIPEGPYVVPTFGRSAPDPARSAAQSAT